MSATSIYIVAVIIYAIGRWTKNEPVASVRTVAAAIFAALIIGLLDQGPSEQAAKGLAWLILAGASLTAIGNGIFNVITKASGGTPAPPGGVTPV